VYNSYQKVSYY